MAFIQQKESAVLRKRKCVRARGNYECVRVRKIFKKQRNSNKKQSEPRKYLLNRKPIHKVLNFVKLNFAYPNPAKSDRVINIVLMDT